MPNKSTSPCPLRRLFEDSKEDPKATINVFGKHIGLNRIRKGQLALTCDGTAMMITNFHKDLTLDEGWEKSYRELYRAAAMLQFGHAASYALLGLPALSVEKRFTFFGIRNRYALRDLLSNQDVCSSNSKETLHKIAGLLREAANDASIGD